MYSMSFKTPENFGVLDKWLLTECTWMGGGRLREVAHMGFCLYSQLSLRRTPLGPVLCVRLREKSVL